MRGCRGATLPALEQRSRTSDSANKQRPARPKRSIGTLCATLNRNAQPRSKRTSPSLVGMQGSDAPRSRATVVYLQLQISNIQPRSTLNRNIQPTPPPLEEMQGGTPCPRIAVAHFPLSKNKQRSDRFKQVIGALRSTLKRNAQPRGKIQIYMAEAF